MVRNYIRKTDRGMTYSKEKLREAIDKVRSGELNGYEASIRYNIPRTTLYDHAKGKVYKSTSLGKPPALSAETEKKIAESLLALEENAFFLGRKEILDLVGLYINSNKLKTPFKAGKPGDCWLVSFSKRNNVATKPLYREFGTQDKGVIVVKEFYSILEMRIDQLDLSDKPGHIWYVEEHSFFQGKSVPNNDKGKDLTVVTAWSAEGRKAPLLTVFKGNESRDWMLGKHINISQRDGMTMSVFKNYFTTIFLNYIDDSLPNLVIFQGESSLIDLDMIEEARKAKVTMIQYPSYLESLDISITRTLKEKWTRIFGDSVQEFAKTMADVFDAVQVTEIEEGFREAGVHPFAEVCDNKFEKDRLNVYEEYKWFKDKFRASASGSQEMETKVTIVKKEPEFLVDFEIDLESSNSMSNMSMTEETEMQSGCSGDILKQALISVKKVFQEQENHSQRSEDTYLTKVEELRIVTWLTDLGNAGFIITEEKVIEAIDNIKGNPSKTPNKQICERFLKTHPKLKEKFSQDGNSYRRGYNILNFYKDDKVDDEALRVWLFRVRTYLKKRNVDEILRDPSRIFNYGEAVFYLNDEHELAETSKDTNADLTVVVTASADGNIQAPSVLFPFKPNESLSFSKAEILSDQITDVFYDWLIDLDVQFPVILFMEPMAHIDLSLYEFCREKKIIPVALHTKMQPLEVIFQPLREHWKNIPKQRLKKEELAKEIESIIKPFYKKDITDSFKNCGIYPFYTSIKDNAKGIETEKNITKNKFIEIGVNNVNFLKEVEKRIAKDLLEEFYKSGEEWKGDLSHFSLFLFWKNAREENQKGGSVDLDPLIDVFEENDE